MIKTKQDLKYYIERDLIDYPDKNILRLWLKGSESYPIVIFIKCLRHYEYYLNLKSKAPFNILKKNFWRFFYRHSQIRFSLYVGTNIAGPGFKLVHPGFRHLMKVGKIGENCTILPMVLIGKKMPDTNSQIEIGDNCYISTGVTLLTPLKIGNNVTIGAGAVVTKDIPDNSIVGGVPAKIISGKK
jgi:serine O-acetyltransferase